MDSDVSKRSQLQKLAYTSLAEYFQEHDNEVVEIAILPPSVQPPDGVLIQEESSLGISKKALALAYMEARRLFFANRQSKDPSTINQTIQATKVILLFDPEHLTAANYRKRVLTQLESEYGLHAGNTFHKALQRELYFLDSVLTSPLHRQSKSPTLWYHRSRIVDSLILVHLTDKLDDQKAVFRNKELGAVCKSGEQHPKNYHAWQYARRLVQKARGFGPDDQLSRLVKQWCCRHPSDISGWSFLLYLMPQLAPSLRQELVRDVLDYAIKFSIENESLWVFIRTALAQDVSSVDHSVTYRRLQDYVQNLANDERPQNEAHTASNALKWIDTYGKHIG
ncbi:hypothetical protein COCC4DRAFT_144130 [Bipolaris maydis ATCC 48331]|uniref:Protein prenyltransferase n=2 Tax=Cochliobolus heterostrophus TaxID=5016 RepID=M2UEP3_COCH5|nr:uncharacterized protein COCC4DRAFT_144130 [Bipolaris maydis ATCC 48331]EMD97014.1 hypothetical protein COCHEDRAFT_1163355 [Bipolaris maydis C5]KAH7564506.1 hypothetical protein BM1_01553 [Bipolaris maydis]EMD97803.1 hypothetical protein COCHEDRAFT_1200379 [Bipolaris maydis C5]ENI02801.1 hypothetical protein COCC4DRAFT_144130 [Bipolaris maydis ATCC 48331]KAJ5031875.1 hypothetical protein J3E73DRAFT_224274 [Bipolaris maydis]